jgi:hypothetical protein
LDNKKLKILVLGNEFIKIDSLAKNIAEKLSNESGLCFKSIDDSFQLLEELNSGNDFVILDVVKGLDKVKIIGVDDLKNTNILTGHDLDSGFILRLIGKEKNIKIIGIPEKGDIKEIIKEVREFI